MFEELLKQKPEITLEKQLRHNSQLDTKYELKEKNENQHINIFDTLNDEQRRAALSDSKYNITIASAGTGKTSTIIARVAHKIKEGVEPHEIVLLTFTSKAGKEMLHRLSLIFGEKIVSQIFAGTFHSYGKHLLAKTKDRRVLKKPKETRIFLDGVYEKVANEYNIVIDENVYKSSTIMEIYNLFINTTNGTVEFEDWFEEKYADHDKGNIFFYHEVIKEYQILKKQYDFLDLNDLLEYIHIYYMQNECKLKEIIVDEYQDTNALQNKALYTMRSSGIFCVGDYDQSIYAFNGSDISIIGSFPNIYEDASVFTLTKNYRSSKNILAIAEKVISINERIFEKKLEPMVTNKNYPPKVITYDYDYEQYSEIAQAIQKDESYDYNDTAIIFRNNSSADNMEAELLAYDIPCDRSDNSSFFTTQDISLLLSFYKILRGSATVIDFFSMSDYLHLKNKQVGQKLYDNAVVLGDGNYIKGFINPTVSNISNLDKASLGFANANKRGGDNIGALYSTIMVGTPQKQLIELHQLIMSAQSATKAKTVIQSILDSKLYKQILQILVAQRLKFSKEKEDDVRQQFEDRHALLLKIALEANSIKEFDRKINMVTINKEDCYGVKLLTVHASKGLEFDSVYVIDLTEGKFPNIKLSAKAGGIEEERRLFYVAVTRAKEKLTLTYALSSEKSVTPNTPSRFLLESGLVSST